MIDAESRRVRAPCERCKFRDCDQPAKCEPLRRYVFERKQVAPPRKPPG